MIFNTRFGWASSAPVVLLALSAAACAEGNGQGSDQDGVLVPVTSGTSDGGQSAQASSDHGASGSTSSSGPGAAGSAGATASPAGGATSSAQGGAVDASSPSGKPAGSAAGASGGSQPSAAGPRVDNPYADVTGYVNPEWKAKAMAEPSGARIANTPTAVWLVRIAAIQGTTRSVSNGSMGLRDHLDAALAQKAGYIQLVIYNLPGRDCSALASNGELSSQELPRYKSEYIDPIAAIMADAKYAALRIINIVEVDSLPNLVTNLNVAKCAELKQNGAYVQGVAYALSKLGALPNTYNYVDAGHHGWLGWDSNFMPSAQLFAEVGKLAGMQNVHGFITNAANYSALKEPFFTVNALAGGQPVKAAKWIEYNQYVDELGYAQGLRSALVSLGFDAKIGMLIDTARNGWGGAERPKAASSATDVNAFINESRVDRRVHSGNWCNQTGAGIGERPRANPESGIDAYVWLKPPGESDGASRMIANEEGKGFDRMCDPTYGGNQLNGNSPTGAMADAPLAGAWFSAHFQMLVKNAYPPL